MHVVELWRPGRNVSFGFSISDGLYEPGVYVRNIQPGGLADQSGQLRALDRLVQVRKAVMACTMLLRRVLLDIGALSFTISDIYGYMCYSYGFYMCFLSLIANDLT